MRWCRSRRSAAMSMFTSRTQAPSAVEEANLAITRYRAQMAAIQMLNKARADARQAVDLATQRYDRGVTDFLNVLDAQREEDALPDPPLVSRPPWPC